MSPSYEVVGHLRSDQGMNTLRPEEFEAVLLDLIQNWLPEGKTVPVIACGMVGARQGWVEAIYRPVPAIPLSSSDFLSVPTRDPRIRVRIIPGLCQQEPGDVMRGEETQLAGLLSETPDFDGLVCLPGTHSKWVDVRDGSVATFKTFLTGELFYLLETQSILRHSLAEDGFDDTAFRQEVELCLDAPDRCLGNLFSLRAGDILHGTPAAVSRARLSARMIAGEILAVGRLMHNRSVTLVGNDTLTQLYEAALSIAGTEAARADGDHLVLRGLSKAHALIETQLEAQGI